MRNTRKVTKEISSVVVNNETGEILESKDYKERMVETEPEFIKIYLRDIERLANLPKGCSNVMYCLLRYMTYDNEVLLTAYAKHKIAETLNTSLQTLDVQIKNLVEQGILTRIARGSYLVNPNLFGRGQWKDIKNIRLTITYDADGRKFYTERNYDKQLAISGLDSPKGFDTLRIYALS